MPHFQLVLPDGEALGATEIGPPGLAGRSIIYRGSGKPDLRVIDRIEAEDTEHGSTVLVVEPVE